MARFLQLTALLWLWAAAATCADQGKAVKPPPPPKKEAAFPRKGGGGGRPGVAPKQGPRLSNPASPAARLYQATPDERERVIEKLPPQQQVRVRNQLAYFDSLSKDQQRIMVNRVERFNALPVEKRRAFAQQLQNMNRLPPDRRQAVAGALRRLQVMPDDRRAQVLDSEQFKRMFSPEEQKMISDLSEVMLPPM